MDTQLRAFISAVVMGFVSMQGRKNHLGSIARHSSPWCRVYLWCSLIDWTCALERECSVEQVASQDDTARDNPYFEEKTEKAFSSK